MCSTPRPALGAIPRIGGAVDFSFPVVGRRIVIMLV